MERATPFERLLAAVIDGVIVFILPLIPFIGWVLAIGYFFTKDALPFLEGQSLGKKVMGIRVIKNGKVITGDFETAIKRTILFIIPLFNIVEGLMVLIEQNGIRFGDKWAETIVIKDKR